MGIFDDLLNSSSSPTDKLYNYEDCIVKVDPEDRSVDMQLKELQKLRDDFDKYRTEQAAYQAAQEHRAKITERKGFWLGIISNGIAAIIGGLTVYYWSYIISFFFNFLH